MAWLNGGTSVKDQLVDLIADIANAKDMESLQSAYNAAYTTARGDDESLAKVVEAKDKRKAQLNPAKESA